MRYVGIDIAKKDHQIAAVDEFGNVILKSFSAGNNESGFAKIAEKLEAARIESDECLVGMEATGHYWISLWEFLDANGYEVVQFEDLPLSVTAVQTGQVDAAVNDNGVLYHFARQHPDTEVTAEFPTGDRYGIGIRKGNAALVREVDDVLGRAHRSGEYDRIYEKWFGRKPR